jgi:hypothetical protein
LRLPIDVDFIRNPNVEAIMQRILFTFDFGLKMALLAQTPLFVLSLILGLTWGASGLEPGFEAVGRLLSSYAPIFAPPLAVVGFLAGVLPGESACE